MHNEARALRLLFEQRVTLSQAEFGRVNDIGTAPMVWQYLNGKRHLNLKVACKFAHALGTPLDMFSPRLHAELQQAVKMAGMVCHDPQLAIASSEEYAQIPRVTLLLRPHTRTFETRRANTAAFIAFRNDWLRERGYMPSHLLAVECPDDAMESTLVSGDVTVLNTAATEPLDGETFALNYEGQLQLRRLVRDDGKWWIECDNPDKRRYTRKHFTEKQCYVLAKVIYRQSERI